LRAPLPQPHHRPRLRLRVRPARLPSGVSRPAPRRQIELLAIKRCGRLRETPACVKRGSRPGGRSSRDGQRCAAPLRVVHAFAVRCESKKIQEGRECPKKPDFAGVSPHGGRPGRLGKATPLGARAQAARRRRPGAEPAPGPPVAHFWALGHPKMRNRRGSAGVTRPGPRAPRPRAPRRPRRPPAARRSPRWPRGAGRRRPA
jgi:hypothetical protein